MTVHNAAKVLLALKLFKVLARLIRAEGFVLLCNKKAYVADAVVFLMADSVVIAQLFREDVVPILSIGSGGIAVLRKRLTICRIARSLKRQEAVKRIREA